MINVHGGTEKGTWHTENAQKPLALLLGFVMLSACGKTIFPRLRRPLLPTYSSPCLSLSTGDARIFLVFRTLEAKKENDRMDHPFTNIEITA